MAVVVRVTRHPADEGRIAALCQAFGADTVVVEDDVPYGDDPVRTILDLIGSHGDVVAVELVAPLPVLAKLLQAKRELGHIKFLRAEFARDGNGRALVVGRDAAGRDILGFSHYVVVKEVKVVTEPLL